MDRIEFKLRNRLEVQPPGYRSNSAMDGYRIPVSYIDFIVNGKSLADLLEADRRDLVSMLRAGDILTEPPAGRDIFNQFIRYPTLFYELTFRIPCRYEFRRVHLYGCPECGDLYCGSVTCQLIETPKTVIWKRFDDGREEFANYMSEDKSYNSGDLYDVWMERGRDYSVLDAFGLSDIEMDYMYMYELRTGKIPLSPDGDILRGDSVQIDFPEIGPYEFDRTEYLSAFNDLKLQVLKELSTG
ncbi:MAG TPA: hypothetical protein PL048_16435 [Leptospiraceae bacterium]|nr:hypothetical protein [Leptospiraceae bacterium]HMY68204.1 hypothetical protein [Leptospiraceae bacterium]HMZ60367.1 hypothetical protein [Leptospiraceae bacterium]HNF27476.1 hypothetical protein [Leptospiraceae bacterium]HNI26982.1 hypothetical protein [Leptospiraceae bacterium]